MRRLHKVFILSSVLSLAIPFRSGPSAQEPTAILTADLERHEILIETLPVDLPATGPHAHGAQGMVQLPISTVHLPFDFYLYGYRLELEDQTGRKLPIDFLHHLNLYDPAHRELFLPVSRRVFAMSKETGAAGAMPWWLLGYPLSEGTPIVFTGMLHNPTGEDYVGARIKLYLQYVKTGRPWPLIKVYPFNLDVAFPIGDRGFDLPPGRFSKSYEASPVIPGRLMLLGTHFHDYAESVRFEDVTTGKVIWETEPIKDEQGRVTGITIGRLYRKLGVKIYPDHLYRVTVEYNNPTADTLIDGGMGVVGGVILPDGEWPEADTTDAYYVIDKRHYMAEVHGRWEDVADLLEDPEAPDTTNASTMAHPHRQ